VTTRLLTKRRCPWVRPALLTALGLSVPWCDAAQNAGAVDDAPRQWQFRVLLDGRPIGEHDFTVSGPPGSETVQTHARFRVTAFFVPVYGYVHQDSEFWRDGCLAHIEAHTSENGHESKVLGSRAESGFELDGPRGSQTLPACISSFAYWDRGRLRAAHLLNPQSGEYEPVALSGQGTESIVIRGHRMEAERYDLAATKFTVKLWYAGDGRWLALESRTARGQTLRYEML
jgi:hypothetical protein